MIRKFCLTLAVISAASFSIVSAQQTAKVTASGIGYLEYLPQGYHSNSNKYPVVISLHGIKEKGTSSTDRQKILAGLEKVDNVGLPKYVNQGTKYPFILISPQLKSNQGNWSGSYIMQVLNHVKKTLRIDDRRIYLTGLSLGGYGVWKTAGDYPDVFAAIAPICPGGSALNKADAIARANLPIWGFHGGSDNIVSHNVTVKMINAVNSRKPKPLAKTTIFPGMGHVIWDKAYKETGLLDWMLSQRKGSSGSSGSSDDDDDEGSGGGSSDDDKASNKAPVVKAGGDRTIQLPTNSVYIAGTASDPDGKIVSYKWTKISGGSVNLKANQAKLQASRLAKGTYVFRLTATDNDGVSRSDDMRLIVKEATKSNDKEDNKNNDKDNNEKPSKNVLPVASAGPDRVITLPTNQVTVKANASDKDGKIVAYSWTQTYGNRASLSGANTDRVRIANLKRGSHIFRLRVTDNDGGVKDDYFKITVKESSQKQQDKTANNNNKNSGKGTSGKNKRNTPPQASAGPDRVITLPTNSVNIRANASDKDGKIVSYQWAKTYGGRASISGGNSQNVRIHNLSDGVYIFRLRVTDNDGAVKDDYFKITVKGKRNTTASNGGRTNTGKNSDNKSGNSRPVANAGPDLRVKYSDGTVRLSGSAKDADGRIVSYRWKLLTGPSNAKISNSNSPNPTVTNLKPGRYYISLIVKDDKNASHEDKMALRVTGS